MRFYVTNSSRRTVADDGEDEESLKTPEELFGKHVDFVMSRMYAGRPNWDFLFNSWTTLYDK